MFEGEFLFDLWSAFLLQLFSRKCVCKLNISKIVRPLLAALSVNGLILCIVPGDASVVDRSNTPLYWHNSVDSHLYCIHVRMLPVTLGKVPRFYLHITTG